MINDATTQETMQQLRKQDNKQKWHKQKNKDE
jgi:hypothetical protein